MTPLDEMDRPMADIAADLGRPLRAEDGVEFVDVPLDETHQLRLMRRDGDFVIRVRHGWWETGSRKPALMTSVRRSADVGFTSPNAVVALVRALEAMHRQGLTLPRIEAAGNG